MKKWMRRMLCLMALLLVAAGSQAYAASPQVTYNIGGHNYQNGGVWAVPSQSNLAYDEQTQTYTRVEYTGQFVVVEHYDRTYNFLDQKIIEMELPIFGGIYQGKDCNFLIFGQENKEEDDKTEVIRVVKYDAQWNRLGQASVFGANTTVPFRAGTSDMVVRDGYLYLRTSHDMYTSSDGVNHQANMTVVIRIADMVVTESYHLVEDSIYGYASHSFNQQLALDEADNSLVALDHGDAAPRSVRLIKCEKNRKLIDVLKICGEVGANETGVSVGGLEVSNSAYLTVGTSVCQEESSYNPFSQRNVFLTVTDRGLTSSRLIWLTDHDENENLKLGNPYLVKINSSRFLVLWSSYSRAQGGRMHYVFINARGEQLSAVHTEAISRETLLSDCEPIVVDGRATWYQTVGTQPQFYTIDVSAYAEQEPATPGVPDDDQKPTEPGTQVPVVNPFTDVPQQEYFYQPVLWAVGKQITNGMTATKFGPGEPCQRQQVVTFLWRAANCPEPKGSTCPFTDVTSDMYSYKAILWAVEQGITQGMTATEFWPEEPCQRQQVVTFLWRAANCPEPKGSTCAFTDVTPAQYSYKAILWAVEKGITEGFPDGHFGNEEPCTRAQIVTFLWRWQNKT